MLAKWRREGGVWHITFVVEGYDETFVMRAPGKLSQKFATGLTRYKLAHELGESPSIVHLQGTERTG